MTVQLIMPVPTQCYGNILWQGTFPMSGGRFPSTHPVCQVHGVSDDGQRGSSATMQAFRDRGYWASCFPEGDGITFDTLHNQTYEQCVMDVQECFGWEVAR